ncbi:hypothetical protein BJX62DRAFT_217353 [Aspergillus germanicus]
MCGIRAPVTDPGVHGVGGPKRSALFCFAWNSSRSSAALACTLIEGRRSCVRVSIGGMRFITPRRVIESAIFSASIILATVCLFTFTLAGRLTSRLNSSILSSADWTGTSVKEHLTWKAMTPSSTRIKSLRAFSKARHTSSIWSTFLNSTRLYKPVKTIGVVLAGYSTDMKLISSSKFFVSE